MAVVEVVEAAAVPSLTRLEALQERPSQRQMDGVNILIKHLSRRFLFTGRLLGSDISQSFPSSLSNPFALPHKHAALSLLLSLHPLFLSLPDQRRRRGQRAGEEAEEQEGRLSDGVVWV